MSVKNLEDLFVHTLKDIYYAEKHITKSLPKMIRAVNDEKLRGLFEDHLDETKHQVERLQQVFDLLGKPAEGEKCPAITGITEEAEELMDEIEDAEALDAALTAAAQAVEHYEISRYGTLCVWAAQLGKDDAKNLLEETLSEEKDADAKLTQIAEDKLNEAAMA